MNEAEKAVLGRLKGLLRQRVQLDELILFGSRARGDAEAESDMDVLVVLADGADAEAREAVSDCAWEAGFDEGIVIVPIVFTRSEWQRGPERHSLLAQSIRAEGVRL